MDLLRHQLEQTPSHANHLALAQGLYDQKTFSEARHHFAEALRLHEGDREGLTEYDAAPKFIRRRDAVWKRRATKMLRDSASPPAATVPST